MNTRELTTVARAATTLKLNGYDRVGARLDRILDHETKGWPIGDEGAAPVEVWVLDVTVEGPETGDYDGWQSVHASRDGALGKLIDKLAEHGVDLGADVETVASAAADNGSLAGDFAVGELAVSYGVHLMPVEP
ncbi:hypothetical protein [Mycobacterium phage Kashi_RDG1]|nr:hypothetical protein [Mycobacterium phage Kashi_RDG1]